MFIDDGVQVCVGPWRGLKLFEVAHLSVLMRQRLPYTGDSYFKGLVEPTRAITDTMDNAR